MGVKKSTVCTRASSLEILYTPASSAVSKPTSTFGSCCRANFPSTASSAAGLSLLAQPAAFTCSVRRYVLVSDMRLHSKAWLRLVRLERSVSGPKRDGPKSGDPAILRRVPVYIPAPGISRRLALEEGIVCVIEPNNRLGLLAAESYGQRVACHLAQDNAVVGGGRQEDRNRLQWSE